MALSDYEDALKSFVLDDDKLVTYKWLSKELEIHVNLAKDILKQYWDKYKSKEKILATLLLVGQLKDGSFRVVVVKESELDSVKQKFAKIDCQHMYSVQKSLPDIELLALVGEGDLRYSAIKCNEEYVRNDDEIENLRYIGNVKKEENKSATTTNKVAEKPIPKKVKFSPTEKSQKQDKEVEAKEKPEEKEKADSEVAVVQEKKKSPPNKSNNNKNNNKTSKKPIQSKQSGFNNLFGKVPNKSQTAPNKLVDSSKDEQINSSDNNKKNEKLLPKETDKKLPKETDKKLTKEKEKLNKEKEKLNKEKEKLNKSKDQEKDKMETQEKENRHSQAEEKPKKVAKTVEKIEKSKPKTKSDTRGKKRNRSQEKATQAKRKRIVVLDSSEDESGKSAEEEEEPMEIEEEPLKVVARRSPSPPAEKRENGKRMVRKTIDKTFKDEEGFLVTKRVHVYEAVSDNEESKVEEKELQKPKPVEAPVKKKQTTLMNFFKKS